MLLLKGEVQHYDWGRVGEESEVARLHALSSGNEIDGEKHYAELWMGTHPSGPSFVFDDDQSVAEHDGTLLNDWLQTHPEALGERVLERWQGELPFLFKVLSISKALSIQAHPDKKLAERLFETQPKIYKDANHKPEMALALTNFEALCGFLSTKELKEVLETVPELRKLINEEELTELLSINASEPTMEEEAKAALRRAFTALMTVKKETLTMNLKALIARLASEKESRKLSAREELVLVLEKQYPDDVGVFASFFLNYIQLKPGEAVYLAANVPHAYISGECVECMATSDNVVRAGLTPKFRDTETLSSMLTYEQGFPDILDGHQVSTFTKRYSPPFDEFEVDMITIPVGESLQFLPIPGPSIFVVMKGRGTVDFAQGDLSVVQKGDMFFLPAGKGLQIAAKAEADVNGNGHGNGQGHENGNGAQFQWAGSKFSRADPIRLYRAGVNSRVLE